MLSRHFRTAGMKRADILERLRNWFVTRDDLDPYAWDALTEFIKPATDDDVAAGQRKIQFGSAVQRYSLIARVLRLLSKERPVVIWLDDLQWATDSLSFLHYVLESEACDDLPVLFVGTLREDALADQSAARSELAKFSLDEKVQHLALEPLEPHIQAQLIEKLLYLAPSLARKVADRTHGNPLFAVQLIGDWVNRGVLEVADEGFVLADGEEAPIPDDLFDVWSSRLDEVLSEVGDEAIRALEIAATLGLEVDENEWRTCLALAVCEFPSEVVQKLLSHRLVEDTDTGVRFVHSMLRESLERRAKESGRLVEHNRICARMLDERYEGERHLAERLGRHLLAARAYLDALVPLLEGAKARGNAAELDSALMLLDMRLDAIEALELADESAPRVENWELRALALTLRGSFEDGFALARKAADAAENLDDPCLHAHCLMRLGQCLQYGAHHREALDLLERAGPLADDACCADWLSMQIEELSGISLRSLGRIEEAVERLTAARRLAVNCDDTRGQVTISRELGSCERRRGNLVKSDQMLREAVTLCEKIGLQLRVGETLLSLADVVRLRGRLDEAEELYRRTLQHGRTIRPPIATFALLNLALLCVQRERYREAPALLEKLQPTLEHTKHSKLQLYADAISLPCLASEEAWASFDSKLDEVLRRVEHKDIVDDDIAICLEQAAKLAATANRVEAASRALRMVLTQWERSGNGEKARATRQELDRIAALVE
jgi:tetratricopeptide (TPR) repeat protein